MASMRDIQRRKASIQSTGQITKAMKLVSTVKLQKAKARVETAKPYFNKMHQTVNSMLARSGGVDHRFLKTSDNKKKAVIVITSNRGLAGGYNMNIAKLLTTNPEFSADNTVVYCIGRKGKEILDRKGYEIKADYSEVVEDVIYRDAMDIQEAVLKDFEAGEFGELYIAYTVFKNTVSHIPTMMKLLPATTGEEAAEEDKLTLMNFEPNEEEALDIIIPKYVTSLIYGSLIEAVASENGARMAAMDSATTNAEEMIEDLSLKFNRARQSSITQELTEIVAGAEAIG